VPRKYSLAVVAVALNLFNIVNRGPENGVLNSALFGQSQTLADGPYGGPRRVIAAFFFRRLFLFELIDRTLCQETVTTTLP
jgi:hypothetical protein